MHGRAQPILDSPPLVRYGLPELVNMASPAAGAHFTQSIDGTFLVRPLSIFCRLVTSATVAERQVLVEYRTAEGNRFSVSGAAVTQSASSTNDWYFDVFQEVAEWPVDDTILIPLQAEILMPTQDFRIFVDNIDATDQLSRIRVQWERFYTTNEPRNVSPHSGT